jgi:LppX_LprAFG lipoprotein
MTDSSIRSGPDKAGRERNIRRLITAAGLFAAAVTLIAGCGSAATTTHGAAPKPLTARQALSLAVSSSQQITSASTTLSVKTTGSTAAATTGSMQMQLKPSLLISANLKVAVAGQTIPVSEIIRDKTIYLKVPGLSQHVGKPWLKISLAQLAGNGAAFSQLLQSVQSGNPLDQTKLLSVSKDVHATGTQVIDGVTTTRYAGSYTPSAALAAMNPSLRKLMGPGLKQIKGNVKFTVWIDAQHRTRRLVATENVNGQTVVTTINITAINQPVSITLPPASQVTTVPSSLLNGSGGGTA